MEKILTDVHTHTTFSPDGRSGIEEMLAAARAKGATVYGIAEHFDYDYAVNGIRFENGPAVYTDAAAYFTRARKLQKEYEATGMEVLVGAEFGYADNEALAPLYRTLVEKYAPDFVVNSVHTDGRYDYADRSAFYAPDGRLRAKEEVYREYFRLVSRSADAPYPFDVIGHLGYCTRYAPYADKRAAYADYRAETDEILEKIVARGKILEINSSSYGAPSDFLPDEDILRRYFALGGRRVSFASDAHDVSRVLDGRGKAVALLRGIGFSYISVPRCGVYREICL